MIKNLQADFENAIRYDVYFERQNIEDQIFNEYKGKKIIDLYGQKKDFSDADYLISTQALPYRVELSFQIKFRPHEQNCFQLEAGKDAFLYNLRVNDKKTTVNELEDLTKIATTTLSELTHYTTIAIGPKIEKHTILDVKFVLLGSRVMMAIILTDSGIIREAIIKFDEDVTEEQIKNLNNIFSNHMVGKPIDQLGDNIETFITNEMQNSISIIKKIITEIDKLFKESDELYLEGTNKSFDLPEFQKAELAKNFMNVLDAKDLVSEVLNTGIAEDINVYIGDELHDEKLKDFSVVTFNHLLGDKDIGTIGIIGPTRMDYSKVISIMKYISKKLKEDYDDENK